MKSNQSAIFSFVSVLAVSCAPIPLPTAHLEPEYVAAKNVQLSGTQQAVEEVEPISPFALADQFNSTAKDVAGGIGKIPTSAKDLANSAKNLSESDIVISTPKRNTQLVVAQKIESRTPMQRVQYGLALLKNGKVGAAKGEFELALKDNPNNKTAQSMLRQIKLTPSEYFENIESVQSYTTNPGDTYSTIAMKYLSNPLEFHILAKFNNQNDAGHLGIGQVINLPKVSKRAKSGPAKLPSQVEFDIAKKYYDQGRYQSAIAILEPRVAAKGKGDKDYESRDLLVLSYTKYAYRLVDKANLLEAQSILEKAVNIQPKNKKLASQLAFVEKQREAEKHYASGLRYLKRGDKDKAFDSFNNALLLKPNHSMAKKQIVKMKSKVIDSLHKKAMTFYKNQELAQAIGNWNKVLKLNPDHDLAKLYRERALELKERLDKLPQR